MMKKELLVISYKDDFSIKDVVTILKFSLILNKEGELREKHVGASLESLWDLIPHKRFWLERYEEERRRQRRKRR